MAVRLSQVIINKITKQYNFKNIPAISKVFNCHQQSFINYSIWDATSAGEETQGQKKKKSSPIPKVSLLHGDEITVLTLEEAHRLSKRRNLKLVKIIDLDAKTQRPIYKLMTGSEYREEDIKDKEQKKKNKEDAIKGEKLVFINYAIADHDLDIQIKKIEKWVGKLYEVRVVINGESNKMQKAVSYLLSFYFYTNIFVVIVKTTNFQGVVNILIG